MEEDDSAYLIAMIAVNLNDSSENKSVMQGSEGFSATQSQPSDCSSVSAESTQDVSPVESDKNCSDTKNLAVLTKMESSSLDLREPKIDPEDHDETYVKKEVIFSSYSIEESTERATDSALVPVAGLEQDSSSENFSGLPGSDASIQDSPSTPDDLDGSEHAEMQIQDFAQTPQTHSSKMVNSPAENVPPSDFTSLNSSNTPEFEENTSEDQNESIPTDTSSLPNPSASDDHSYSHFYVLENYQEFKDTSAPILRASLEEGFPEDLRNMQVVDFLTNSLSEHETQEFPWEDFDIEEEIDGNFDLCQANSSVPSTSYERPLSPYNSPSGDYIENDDKEIDSTLISERTKNKGKNCDDLDHLPLNMYQTFRLMVLASELSGDPDGILYCPYCHYSSSDWELFKKHLFQHEDEDVFKCPYCTYKSKSMPRMRSHLKVHSLDRPYKCTVCELTFKRKQNLAQHLKSHSTMKRKTLSYSCDKCNYQCVTKKSYMKHVNTKHANEEAAGENEAGVSGSQQMKGSYKTNYLLERLEESGSNENVVSSTQEVVLSRIPKSMNKQFTCPYCDFSTPRKCSLGSHIRSHRKMEVELSTVSKSGNFRNPIPVVEQSDLYVGESSASKSVEVDLTAGTKNLQSQDSVPELPILSLASDDIYSCPYCSFSCSIAEVLKVHICQHPNELLKYFIKTTNPIGKCEAATSTESAEESTVIDVVSDINLEQDSALVIRDDTYTPGENCDTYKTCEGGGFLRAVCPEVKVFSDGLSPPQDNPLTGNTKRKLEDYQTQIDSFYQVKKRVNVNSDLPTWSKYRKLESKEVSRNIPDCTILSRPMKSKKANRKLEKKDLYNFTMDMVSVSKGLKEMTISKNTNFCPFPLKKDDESSLNPFTILCTDDDPIILFSSSNPNYSPSNPFEFSALKRMYVKRPKESKKAEEIDLSSDNDPCRSSWNLPKSELEDLTESASMQQEENGSSNQTKLFDKLSLREIRRHHIKKGESSPERIFSPVTPPQPEETNATNQDTSDSGSTSTVGLVEKADASVGTDDITLYECQKIKVSSSYRNKRLEKHLPIFKKVFAMLASGNSYFRKHLERSLEAASLAAEAATKKEAPEEPIVIDVEEDPLKIPDEAVKIEEDPQNDVAGPSSKDAPNDEPLDKYSCPQCGKMFGRKCYLACHMRSHRTILPSRKTSSDPFNRKRKLSCMHCAFKTNMKSAMLSHIRSHFQKYLCALCSFECHYFRELHSHCHRVHKSKASSKCLYCNFVAYTMRSLKDHFKDNHATEIPFECEECSLRFETRLALEEHSHQTLDSSTTKVRRNSHKRDV